MPRLIAPAMNASQSGSRQSMVVTVRLPSRPRNASPPSPPLQPLEVRQHVRIAPAAIAELRPGVEILALAAVVDVTVDRGRAAEGLAARRIDAAAAGPRAHLLLVRPVDALHVKGLDKTRRQMDVGMPVAGPGFEHADAGAGILAEPAGEHAARRARAHDHVIECIH